jgi:hypothetical protein
VLRVFVGAYRDSTGLDAKAAGFADNGHELLEYRLGTSVVPSRMIWLPPQVVWPDSIVVSGDLVRCPCCEDLTATGHRSPAGTDEPNCGTPSPSSSPRTGDPAHRGSGPDVDQSRWPPWAV